MTDNIMDEIERINNIKRMKNKKKLHSLLDKYGSLENFRQNSTMAEDFEYQFAQGDSIIDEVEQERQAISGLPKQQGSSLDDIDMMRNASIHRARNELAKENYRKKREENIMQDVDNEVDNWSKKDLYNYVLTKSNMEQNVYKILKNLPEYQILIKNQAKMDKVGTKIVNEFGKGEANGIDNLYHKRGMYEIGQLFGNGSILSPAIGLSLGYGKEILDIKKKYKKHPMKDNLLDSLKDLGNNLEGLVDGYQNDKLSSEYYKGFDYKRNKR
jgi:predicted DNA-binding protein YlxM (UPF0122 family)